VAGDFIIVNRPAALRSSTNNAVVAMLNAPLQTTATHGKQKKKKSFTITTHRFTVALD